MIVRYEKSHYVFITQHDHAFIAGEFLARFKKEFITIDHYESLKFAIYQHDRAWIIPDSHPLLDDFRRKPFSYFNYPEKLKFHFLKLGIDQIDLANSYSAILCSMHYANLFRLSTDNSEREFYAREKIRQKHLMNKLKIQNEDLLSYQLRILQFCDNLSMYICQNTPGVIKEEEVAVYRDGFRNSSFFHHHSDTKIVAFFRDINKNNIGFNSSPFEKPFEVKLPVKRIEKALIKDIGIEDAYQYTESVNITYKIF